MTRLNGRDLFTRSTLDAMKISPGKSPPAAIGRIGWAVRFIWLGLRRALNWIGRHELPVLVGMLVLVVSVWAFIAIADEVVEGETQDFDRWALRSLRVPGDLATPIGPKWLHEVGRDLTALGGIAVLSLMVTAVAGFLWLRRLYGAMWLVIISTLSGLAVSTGLKLLFERERPSDVTPLSHVMSHSFPSGHSMLSAVVYLTLGALLGRIVEGWRFKAYFLIVAVLLTVLVGLSRIYLGVHYPTDVLAGWAAGLAWAVLCWLVARFLQRRGKVEAPAGVNDLVNDNDAGRPTSAPASIE
jgi:undecaprenyl-diphosphatase